MRLACALLLVGCAGRQAPPPAIWVDDDRHLIARPEPRDLPDAFTAADDLVLRPLTNALRVRTRRPAANVNAFGEVPDSTWFTNRIGLRGLSPEEAARGPCGARPTGPWVISGAKLEGFHPGFFVTHAPTGDRWLIKVPMARKAERAVAADVVGSRIYWAAGYGAPCNEAVDLSPDDLVLPPGVTHTEGGPALSRDEVDAVLAEGLDIGDGRVRAVASRFLPGEPLGPFTYEGVRADDPNDVVPHEDRRELRGSRVLAAWIGHWDARPQNTLDTFVRVGDRGYVTHHLLDFGESLGSLWSDDPLSRQLNRAYYVDVGRIGRDLLSFGLVDRPEETVTRSEEAPLFGYFDVAHFDPARWKPGLPNPAFRRMDPRDGYWAASIVARFTDDHLEAIVDEAALRTDAARSYLVRTLAGRRDRIVATWVGRRTPLEEPRTRGFTVRFTDRLAPWRPPDDAGFEVRIDGGDWSRPRVRGAHVEVDVPTEVTDEVVVEARADGARPARFTFRVDDGGLVPVAIRR